MKPTDLIRCLHVMAKTRIPVFIWGSPGIGKSHLIQQFTLAENKKAVDVRALLMDPVDVRGFPFPDPKKESMKWLKPDWFPTEPNTILFLDELNAATPVVQAAFYQLMTDRKIGNHTLPDDTIIIAAGNLETDRAVVSRMPTPLKSRFQHFTLEVDLEDWIKWAIEHSIQSEIIAFLRFRPNLIHNFAPEKNTQTFPCPRTWEYVSGVLDTDPDSDLIYDLIAGLIGNGAASEFVGFLQIYKELPDPNYVINNPTNVDIPNKPATLYALIGALARKTNIENIDNVLQFANRLPQEYSVLLVQDLKRLDPDLTQTKACIEWAIAHQNVLL